MLNEYHAALVAEYLELKTPAAAAAMNLDPFPPRGRAYAPPHEEFHRHFASGPRTYLEQAQASVLEHNACLGILSQYFGGNSLRATTRPSRGVPGIGIDTPSADALQPGFDFLSKAGSPWLSLACLMDEVEDHLQNGIAPELESLLLFTACHSSGVPKSEAERGVLCAGVWSWLTQGAASAIWRFCRQAPSDDSALSYCRDTAAFLLYPPPGSGNSFASWSGDNPRPLRMAPARTSEGLRRFSALDNIAGTQGRLRCAAASGIAVGLYAYCRHIILSGSTQYTPPPLPSIGTLLGTVWELLGRSSMPSPLHALALRHAYALYLNEAKEKIA